MKGNGLGPENKGPKTGRGLGFCYGWGKSGYLNNKTNSPELKPGNGYGYHQRWSDYAEKVQTKTLP
jgi:hypothetical protein